jgi:hypothetical protein
MIPSPRHHGTNTYAQEKCRRGNRDRRPSGLEGTEFGKVSSLKDEREDPILTKTSRDEHTIRVHSMETKEAGRKARNFRKRGRIKLLKTKPINKKDQHDTPTLAPGLGTDFENESAFCL